MPPQGPLALLLLVATATPPVRAESAREVCERLMETLRSAVPSLRLTGEVAEPSYGLCLPAGAPTHSFSGRGSFAAIANTKGPDEVLREALVAAGWTAPERCFADAPGGSTFALRKGDVLVVAEGRWDAGDDAHPEIAVRDDYELAVFCVDRGARGPQPLPAVGGGAPASREAPAAGHLPTPSLPTPPSPPAR